MKKYLCNSTFTIAFVVFGQNITMKFTVLYSWLIQHLQMNEWLRLPTYSKIF